MPPLSPSPARLHEPAPEPSAQRWAVRERSRWGGLLSRGKPVCARHLHHAAGAPGRRRGRGGDGVSPSRGGYGTLCQPSGSVRAREQTFRGGEGGQARVVWPASAACHPLHAVAFPMPMHCPSPFPTLRRVSTWCGCAAAPRRSGATLMPSRWGATVQLVAREGRAVRRGWEGPGRLRLATPVARPPRRLRRPSGRGPKPLVPAPAPVPPHPHHLAGCVCQLVQAGAEDGAADQPAEVNADCLG